MIQVIGSGFGRTGTKSLKTALEILGVGPCYHMEEVLKRPSHIKAWYNISRDQPADWATLFQGFKSAVDFPASIFYKELLAAYPEAKVIHTVRDPARWYDSTYETIYNASALFPLWLRKIIPTISYFSKMERRLIWERLFEGRFEDRQRTLEFFEAYTNEVKKSVPAEQLLIFSVKEGWEPLCTFLDLPVPDVPFPFVNDRVQFKRRTQMLRFATTWGAAGLVILILALLYMIVL